MPRLPSRWASSTSARRIDVRLECADDRKPTSNADGRKVDALLERVANSRA
jgi:hypothetical protein